MNKGYLKNTMNKKKFYDRLGRRLKLGDQFIYMTGGKDGKPAMNHLAQVVAEDQDGTLHASKIKSEIYKGDDEFITGTGGGHLGILRKTWPIVQGKGGIIILNPIDEDEELPNAKIW